MASERKHLVGLLADLHAGLSGHPQFSAINRIAMAQYQPTTNRLVAVAAWGTAIPELDMMHCPLDAMPALAILASSTRPRVIDDLRRGPRGPLTSDLLAAGCRSSMTIPLWAGEDFLGFVFVDATEPAFFDGWRIGELMKVAAKLGRLLGRRRASTLGVTSKP